MLQHARVTAFTVSELLRKNQQGVKIHSPPRLRLILFSMGFFGVAKICHTYPTMMKVGTVVPYIRKIQNIVLLTSAFFHRKPANFALLANTDID